MNSTEYNIGELSTFLLLTVHHSQYTHRLYFSVSVDRHWKRIHLTDCSAWTKHSTEYKHPHKLDYKVVFVFVNTENANNQQNKPSNNRKLHGLELVLNSQLHKSTFTVHENATKHIHSTSTCNTQTTVNRSTNTWITSQLNSGNISVQKTNPDSQSSEVEQNRVAAQMWRLKLHSKHIQLYANVKH